MNNKPDINNISLDALKAGDKAEFARLVDAYSPRIYHIVLRIVADPHDAEDILQETFLKAFSSIGSFEGRSSISTWLYRIATNEALMLLRKKRPQVSLSDNGDFDDEDETQPPVQIVDWCCLPEQELLNSEAHTFMQQAVQVLSPALRVVFILRDIQNLSVRETAEILGLTEEAVKTRLLRARLRLRDELSGYYSERLAERSKK